MTTRRTVDQFRRFVVRPTLRHIGLHSDAACELLVGTALYESGLDHFDQWCGEGDVTLGPALGVYQIEAPTHEDVHRNFLQYRTQLLNAVLALSAPAPSLPEQLVTNLAYATAIARVIYLRSPAPLPRADDVDGMAALYKLAFNTPAGKGTAAGWAAKYRSLCQ